MVKKKIGFFVTLLIIILIISGIIFSISPVKNISLPKNKGTVDGQIAQLDSKVNVKSDRIEVSYFLTEDDFNNMLYRYIKNDVNLSGLKTEARNNQIKVYANTKVLSIIPTQVIIDFEPYVKNDTINFTLKNVSVGRISVPKAYYNKILKKINSAYVYVQNNDIILKKKSIEPFKVKNYSVNSGKIRLDLYYYTK
ncbi:MULTISPECIES: hypothetical protein [Clostridium]|uniref:hypothetical protein n=1 Tax=Clostridium TaxID=1485 RepID=UPI0008240396|nr:MULTISPECIES: hypothetical protein [Clostridium]PJI08402.1 hypothetical protein CUB90_11260 [Clostridium sp. CT7]